MVNDKSQTRACGASSHRLEYQAPIRLASHTLTARLGWCGVRIPRQRGGRPSDACAHCQVYWAEAWRFI